MDAAWQTLISPENSNHVNRQSLQTLYSNRQHLSRITLNNATALVAACQFSDVFSRHACLSLMTRWALEQQRYILAAGGRNSSPSWLEVEQHAQLLHNAVTFVLNHMLKSSKATSTTSQHSPRCDRDCTYLAFMPAAILFLGSAYAGLGSTEIKHAIWDATCQAMQLHGRHMVSDAAACTWSCMADGSRTTSHSHQHILPGAHGFLAPHHLLQQQDPFNMLPVQEAIENLSTGVGLMCQSLTEESNKCCWLLSSYMYCFQDVYVPHESASSLQQAYGLYCCVLQGGSCLGQMLSAGIRQALMQQKQQQQQLAPSSQSPHNSFRLASHHQVVTKHPTSQLLPGAASASPYRSSPTPLSKVKLCLEEMAELLQVASSSADINNSTGLYTKESSRPSSSVGRSSSSSRDSLITDMLPALSMHLSTALLEGLLAIKVTHLSHFQGSQQQAMQVNNGMGPASSSHSSAAEIPSALGTQKVHPFANVPLVLRPSLQLLAASVHNSLSEAAAAAAAHTTWSSLQSSADGYVLSINSLPSHSSTTPTANSTSSSPIISNTTPSINHPIAACDTSRLMLHYAGGHCYARFRSAPPGSPGNQALQVLQIQGMPSSPLGLSGAAVQLLLDLCLPLEMLSHQAMKGAHPSGSMGWLRRHMQGTLYCELGILAKCVIEDLKSLLEEIRKPSLWPAPWSASKAATLLMPLMKSLCEGATSAHASYSYLTTKMIISVPAAGIDDGAGSRSGSSWRSWWEFVMTAAASTGGGDGTAASSGLGSGAAASSGLGSGPADSSGLGSGAAASSGLGSGPADSSGGSGAAASSGLGSGAAASSGGSGPAAALAVLKDMLEKLHVCVMSIAVTAADVLQAEASTSVQPQGHTVPPAASSQPCTAAAAASTLDTTAESSLLWQLLLGARDVFFSWLGLDSSVESSKSRIPHDSNLLHSSSPHKAKYSHIAADHRHAELKTVSATTESPAVVVEVAAKLFDVMSNVAFCQVPGISLSTDLSSRLLPILQSSSHGCHLLLDLLPCYQTTVCAAWSHGSVPLHSAGPCSTIPGSRIGNDTATLSGLSATLSDISGLEADHVSRSFQEGVRSRWQVDAGLVAKLLSVLPAAAACLSSVPHDQMEAAVKKLLPYCFLLLRHEQEGASMAAHSLVGAVIGTLCDADHVRLSSHMLPFYVKRSLQFPWESRGQIQGLVSGLPAAMSRILAGVDDMNNRGLVNSSMSRILAGVDDMNNRGLVNSSMRISCTAQQTADLVGVKSTCLWCMREVASTACAWLKGEIIACKTSHDGAFGRVENVARNAALLATHSATSQVDDSSSAAASVGSSSANVPARPVPDFSQVYTAAVGSYHARVAALTSPPIYINGGSRGSSLAVAVAAGTQNDPLTEAGTQLVNLTCSFPLICEWSVVQQATKLAGTVVTAAAPGPAKAAVLQHLHDMLIRSDDYTRKAPLAHWYHQLVTDTSNLNSHAVSMVYLASRH
ncbi:hypothetical protein CEUSTIGMA_g6785.t1 [Chlamydomonas eustigma]|uniref:Uncharacterized protein n=1 Tax=Chlamydomonas eustigma TaxID=1157962 RepID=A0A250X8E3_9CHLO|nr:hypothetical protein CEUSTIGMA_g6785.t1 [Chlamydomonas eustigma]|eukprot:GAX79343.1 hypothetical protein CEUSTIGMA_g6785.t1 [Chlamydomonas eustigma]